jgi:anti-sigma regulatory factor (Ser/Thr protein kinase)
MRLSLFPTVQAPGEARRGVAALAERIDEESLSDVRTVVSELVTISVAHGASRPLELSLDFFDEQVRGVLDDHGPGTRAIIRAKEMKDSSLVLRIVDALVEEWGTDPEERQVWFKMHVRPLSVAPARHHS